MKFYQRLSLIQIVYFIVCIGRNMERKTYKLMRNVK